MINIPCPSNEKYDAHQIAGAEYIHKTPGNIFVCDEMGQGKTVTVIAYLNYRRINRVLVISKANGVPVWQTHMNKWHMMNPVVEEYHPDKPFFMADILLTHYHWLQYEECARQLVRHFPFDICVLDELHTIRTGNSKRAKYLFKKGVGVCRAARIKNIVTTGTPLFNRVEGMYPMLKGLRPDVIDNMNKEQYGMKYCAGRYNSDGQLDFSGASNVDELAKRMSKTCMIRRLPPSGPSELPTLHTPKIIYLRPGKKRKELVHTFDENFKKDYDVYNDDGTELATLRRELGETKVSPGVEYILKVLKRVPKVIVFCYHREVVKQVHKLLSEHVECLKLIGGMARKKSAEHIAYFQAAPKNKPLGIVASITAFGDSVTLTAAYIAIYLEQSYIWNENKQAIKRLHRRGQTMPVRSIFLAMPDSFDERVLKINFDKIKTDKDFQRGCDNE